MVGASAWALLSLLGLASRAAPRLSVPGVASWLAGCPVVVPPAFSNDRLAEAVFLRRSGLSAFATDTYLGSPLVAPAASLLARVADAAFPASVFGSWIPVVLAVCLDAASAACLGDLWARHAGFGGSRGAARWAGAASWLLNLFAIVPASTGTAAGLVPLLVLFAAVLADRGLVLPFVAALLALFLIDMESALYFALPLASGALFGWRGKRQGKEWQGAMLGHENVEKKGGEGQVARERGGGGASVSGEVGTDGAGGGAQEGGREGAAGTREDSSPRGLAGCFKALGREVSGALRWRPGSWRVAAVVTALAGVTALSAARVALWVSCRHASGESHIVTQPWPWMHVLHDRVCEWAPARALSPYESSPALGLSWYVRALIFPEARALFHAVFSVIGPALAACASIHLALDPTLALASAAVAAATRAHPTWHDVALAVGIVTWAAGQGRLSRCRHWQLWAGLCLWPPLVAPFVHYAWAERKAANANFLFGANLAYVAGAAGLLWEMISADGEGRAGGSGDSQRVASERTERR